MNCLFSKFHTEGTVAGKYKAAKIMAVPFINFQAVRGMIGNAWAFVVGTRMGQEGLLLVFTVLAFFCVPPSPVYNYGTFRTNAPPSHCSSTSSPLVSKSFLHQLFVKLAIL